MTGQDSGSQDDLWDPDSHYRRNRADEGSEETELQDSSEIVEETELFEETELDFDFDPISPMAAIPVDLGQLPMSPMFTEEEVTVPRFFNFRYVDRTLMPEYTTHFREPDETIPARIPGNNTMSEDQLFEEAFKLQTDLGGWRLRPVEPWKMKRTHLPHPPNSGGGAKDEDNDE